MVRGGDGGKGLDVAVVDDPRAAITVAADGGRLALRGPGLATEASAVERVTFIDGTLVFGPVPARIYRLYEAVFDRDADPPGSGFWVSRMDAGISLCAVAERFVDSPEFTSALGDARGDGAFVGALCTNVLGRASDVGGTQQQAR